MTGSAGIDWMVSLRRATCQAIDGSVGRYLAIAAETARACPNLSTSTTEGVTVPRATCQIISSGEAGSQEPVAEREQAPVAAGVMLLNTRHVLVKQRTQAINSLR